MQSEAAEKSILAALDETVRANEQMANGFDCVVIIRGFAKLCLDYRTVKDMLLPEIH